MKYTLGKPLTEDEYKELQKTQGASVAQKLTITPEMLRSAQQAKTPSERLHERMKAKRMSRTSNAAKNNMMVKYEASTHRHRDHGSGISSK